MVVETRASRSSSVLLGFLVGGAVPTLSLVVLALVVVFGLLLGERIVGVGALQSMAFQLPELGILSLAMMVALLSGGLNLSIIATANLCALTMAWVLTTYVPAAHGFMWGGWQVIAVLAGVGVAMIVGLVNGFVIAYLGVSPILATLGTMTMCKGLSIGMTRGNVISGFPEPVVFLGNGTVLGVPVALVVFLALCVPMAVLLNKSPFGHKIYMIGSSEKATRYSGVDTKRVLLGVYVCRVCSRWSPRCGHDGALQLCQRRVWRRLPAGDDPRGSARRCRSLRRVRQGGRPGHGADPAAGDLLGVQSARFQPVPDSRDLGALIVIVTALGVVVEAVGASERSGALTASCFASKTTASGLNQAGSCASFEISLNTSRWRTGALMGWASASIT